MPAYAARLGAFVGTERTAGAREAAAAAAAAAWEPLGPGNIGGRTRVLLVDPRDHDVLYAAAVSGGVWKTEDAGASWRPLSDDLANLTVNSLAFDTSDPDVLYAGTGEGYFREEVRGTGLPLRGAGIFKSVDAGATWERLPATAGADFHWVNDLVVSVADPRRVYAATRTGVWRSRDGGASWTRVLATTVTGGCLDLAARTDRPGDSLFASCGTFEQARVYRNTAAEGAGAWTQVLTEAGMGRTSLAIAPSNQDVVYALAASNLAGPGGTGTQGLHAVFRSTAGGAAGTWQARVRNTSSRKVDTLLLTNPIVAAQRECGGTADRYVTMGWYVNVIAVDPVNPERVWAAGVDLFRSSDGGATWGPASYWWTAPPVPSFAHADQHGITFHPLWDGAGNQTMFTANDGGVYRTDNALAPIGTATISLCDPSHSQVRWTALNHGLGITQFYHGAPFPGGRAYLGGTQDNGTLIGADGDGSDGWRRIFGGDGGYVAVDPSHPATVYVESQGFNLQRSDDGGATFVPATDGITDPFSGFLFITPFVLDPREPARLWTGGRRVWRSNDRAELWEAASATLDDGGCVSAITASPLVEGRVLCGTDEGTLYRNDYAVAAGPGTEWSGVRPRAGFVTSVAFDPADAEVAYATYGGFGGAHVWRSGDAGATWAPLDGSGAGALPDVPVHCLLPDPLRPQRLFLGTDLGVLVSLDGGASWAVEHTGFATVVTESLSFTRASGGATLLFAFTHGRGAWRVEAAPAAKSGPRPPRRRVLR